MKGLFYLATVLVFYLILIGASQWSLQRLGLAPWFDEGDVDPSALFYTETPHAYRAQRVIQRALADSLSRAELRPTP